MNWKMKTFYCFMGWIVTLGALPVYYQGDWREAVKLIGLVWLFFSPMIIFMMIGTFETRKPKKMKKTREEIKKKYDEAIMRTDAMILPWLQFRDFKDAETRRFALKCRVHAAVMFDRIVTGEKEGD